MAHLMRKIRSNRGGAKFKRARALAKKKIEIYKQKHKEARANVRTVRKTMKGRNNETQG